MDDKIFEEYIQEKKLKFLQTFMIVGAIVVGIVSIDYVVRGFYIIAITNYTVAILWVILSRLIRVLPFLVFAHLSMLLSFISFALASVVGFNYDVPYYTAAYMIPIIALVFLPVKHAVFWIVISVIFFLTIDYSGAYAKQLMNNQVMDRPVRVTLISGAIQMLVICYMAYYYRYLADLLNKKIVDQNKHIEKVQRYKDQFVANMNHELRTPMNAIKGISELLMQEKLNMKDKNELVEALNKSSNHLLSIINDILDLAKIEDQKLRLEHIEFDLRETVYSGYNMLKYNAAEKGLKYNLNIDSKLPKYVIGDPHRLTQIVVNLLSNAIKFTEEGEVSLEVKCQKDCDEELKVNDICNLGVFVKDSGRGIPDEAKERLFKPFEQGEISDGKRGGTGLGLTITKKLVEMQNGKINFESSPKGTTFRVEISYKITQSQEPMNSTESNSKDDLINQSLKILLVEDNKLNQMVAVRLLTSKLPQAQFFVANDGREGFEMYKSEEPIDLVLMDLQMPEMNGYEATNAIRKYEEENQKSSVPILAMTADVSEKVMENCLANGFNDYIGKPFNTSVLVNKILRFLPNNE